MQKKITRFHIYLILLLLPMNIHSQVYPVSSIDFGWFNRTYYEGNQNDTGFEKSAVGNLFTPCKMTISIVDLIRMKNTDQEKALRFGDYIGLSPIYAGSTKVYNSNGTSKEIGFGTGFSLGGFVLYHFKPQIGVGVNVKCDVSLDAINNSKSFYSYYEPLIYYSVLGHYKHFSLQFSTTIHAQPRTDNLGYFMNKTSQVVELKYLLGSKNYLVTSYEILNGNWTNVSDNSLFRKDRFNTFYLGFGFKL